MAVLNYTKPVAHLLSPQVYHAMLQRLSTDLKAAIQKGINRGPAIPAEEFSGVD